MADRRTIPELGPSLGHLADAPVAAVRSAPLRWDDLRIELVTCVFELAGAGRRFAATGDYQSALQSLGRAAWLGAWEHAIAAAAARLTEVVNTGFMNAAGESRFPAKRLRQLVLTPDDTRAIAARLGSGGADFLATLDVLEQATAPASVSGDRGHDAWLAWQQALGATARRLESAWLAAETAANQELGRWQGEIARVRAWRRPAWPLWLAAGAVLAAATYIGLVLGGYRPVPPPLQGVADFWWTWLWI